jgi:hypothetical protein
MGSFNVICKLSGKNIYVKEKCILVPISRAPAKTIPDKDAPYSNRNHKGYYQIVGTFFGAYYSDYGNFSNSLKSIYENSYREYSINDENLPFGRLIEIEKCERRLFADSEDLMKQLEDNKPSDIVQFCAIKKSVLDALLNHIESNDYENTDVIVKKRLEYIDAFFKFIDSKDDLVKGNYRNVVDSYLKEFEGAPLHAVPVLLAAGIGSFMRNNNLEQIRPNKIDFTDEIIQLYAGGISRDILYGDNDYYTRLGLGIEYIKMYQAARTKKDKKKIIYLAKITGIILEYFHGLGINFGNNMYGCQNNYPCVVSKISHEIIRDMKMKGYQDDEDDDEDSNEIDISFDEVVPYMNKNEYNLRIDKEEEG